MNPGLRNRIYSYFVKKHGAFEYRNGWLRLPICPFCGKEEKFGVRISTDQTNCFVCGGHGSVIDCIEKIEGSSSSYVSLNRLLELYEGLEYSPKKYTVKEEVPLLLPGGYTNIRFGETPVALKARKYLIGRKFSIEFLSKKGIGYIADPKSDHYNHIIIPYYSGGRLIYYQARRYDGLGPRYNNPKIEDFGIRKNHIIYNGDSVGLYPEMNLFEGVFNALTLGDSSIAIGSKIISRYQMSFLKKKKVHRWNIIMDGDAWDYGFSMAFGLIPYCDKLRVILLESDQDPNDLGAELTQYWINQAPDLENFKDIIKWRNHAADRQRELKKLL